MAVIKEDGVVRQVQKNGKKISEKVDRELIKETEKQDFAEAYNNDNLKECIRLLALWTTGEDVEEEM